MISTTKLWFWLLKLPWYFLEVIDKSDILIRFDDWWYTIKSEVI